MKHLKPLCSQTREGFRAARLGFGVLSSSSINYQVKRADKH